MDADRADTSSAPKTFCEFFAGIGLVHEALAKSGWRCVLANDIDPQKQAMYAAHFGASEHFHLGDVWDTPAIVERLAEPPFLATASFPCTDLSLAGRRAGFDGHESSSFFGFAKVLEVLGDERPPLVMLENVCGFLTARRGRDFRRAAATLADLGYWLDAFQLDAAYFTPQSRPRLFVLGFHERTGLPGLVRRQADAPLLGDPWRRTLAASPLVRPARLVAAIEALDLPTGWAAAPLPTPPRCETTLRGVIDVDEDQDWWSADLVEKHYGMMSPRHRAEVDRLLAAGDQAVHTIFRRIRQGQQRAEVRFDGLAGCLRTPRGGSARQIVLVVDAGQLKMRWMSPREYARLQGAGDFTIDCTASKALFGFGDAVCVPAVAWIDRHVLTPFFAATCAESPRSDTPIRRHGRHILI